jgi:hypothetical protein
VTPSEKLVQRIKADLGLDVISVRPLNRGHQADSILKWDAKLADGTTLESFETVAACLRASRLEFQSAKDSINDSPLIWTAA